MEIQESNRTEEWNKDLSAVIVTYNPDERLLQLLDRLKGQVHHTIIVDNATRSERAGFLADAIQFPNVTMIMNPENMGVAAGLNQGINKADMLGSKWVITLDQDSKPDTDMVEKLRSLLQCQENSARIAIIAPRIIDSKLGRSSHFLRQRSLLLFERAKCDHGSLKNVTTVITAGAMIRLAVVKELGGFQEDFFIDYVDTEFCLRLRQRGYRIIVACDAHLQHCFGNRRKSHWGPFVFYPTFHSPERWYTISRNRIQMIKSFGLRIPHWLFYELTAMTYVFIRMLLTEDQRRAKLLQFFHGTWDGLRGRMGAPPWAIDPSLKDVSHG